MNLSWSRLTLHLRHKFTIARGTESVAETVLVELEHDGIVGLGESAPNAYYGQDVASAEAALVEMRQMLGEDPYDRMRIVQRLVQRFDSQRATVAAIDAALHDWIGKRLNVPVWQMLGLDRHHTPLTSFTIGIDQPAMIAQKVDEATEFPILKIKLGSDQDMEILRTIRDRAPGKPLYVDANAAWTVDEALNWLPQLAELGVVMVEQPLRSDDLDGLARLTAAKILPIVADESCVRPADVPKLAGCVDGVNIKLSKCGGIGPGLQMIHTARSLGLGVMLGCMIESSVGIAAAVQLTPFADWVDLDGHLLLSDDPFEGIGGEGGRLTLSAGPGLGVTRRDGLAG